MGKDQIRLLIVEDVPQVAQYIRGLLNSQSAISLLDVLTDGSKAVGQISQLRPDVLVVDALLQGRVKGLQLVDQLHSGGIGVPIIVLTVPQHPIEPDPERGIQAVLMMPFSGFDLMNKVSGVHRSFQASEEAAGSRVLTVFAPKGGVGKTTVAFNLAVAMAQAGRSTALIDGNLQFGDLRSLLKVPPDAPSILDLPTDRVKESDLADVMWRDPSGVDILLAPPRIEQAEMVTVRDVDKILSLLRRVYAVVVIDTPAALTDTTLSFLDACDTIIEIVTFDSTTIHNTLAMADTFRSIGYSPSKVRYLVNRADSSGGMDLNELAKAIGRMPEHFVVSDGRLVIEANNGGVPFVLTEPGAQVSLDIIRVASELLVGDRVPVGARR